MSGELDLDLPKALTNRKFRNISTHNPLARTHNEVCDGNDIAINWGSYKDVTYSSDISIPHSSQVKLLVSLSDAQLYELKDTKSGIQRLPFFI